MIPLVVRLAGGRLNDAKCAGYALEGAVLKRGEKTRVTVQLTDAASGESVWLDSYDLRDRIQSPSLAVAGYSAARPEPRSRARGSSSCPRERSPRIAGSAMVQWRRCDAIDKACGALGQTHLSRDDRRECVRSQRLELAKPFGFDNVDGKGF